MNFLQTFVSILTIPLVAAYTCEPVTIPICKEIGYQMTKYPNGLGQYKQVDAGHEINQLFPLVKIGCSSHLQEFLCTIYAPNCDPASPDEHLVLPSRKVCEVSRHECNASMKAFNISWPRELQCDRFPDDSMLVTGTDILEPSLEEFDESTGAQNELTIKYSTDSITFASCCQVYYYTQKVFSLPSDADIEVRSADVRSSSVPKVTWKSGSKRKGYTTIMMVTGYTETKSSTAKPHVYTNWMVTNMINGQVSSGITIKEYEGPQPTQHTDNRVYFLLYQHPKQLKINSIGKYNYPENSRSKMNLESLITDNKMVLVSSKYMIVNVDEYSRFRAMQELGLSEKEVCGEISSYPKACKKTGSLVPYTLSK